MTQPTMLDRVRRKLAKKKGAALLEIAERSEISYDTLLRIRDGKTDPAFGKVQALSDLLLSRRKA
jgi:predicted transcriptional regulator